MKSFGEGKACDIQVFSVKCKFFLLDLGPQKPSVTPQMPMKPLFWKKIKLNEIRNPYSGADVRLVPFILF